MLTGSWTEPLLIPGALCGADLRHQAAGNLLGVLDALSPEFEDERSEDIARIWRNPGGSRSSKISEECLGSSFASLMTSCEPDHHQALITLGSLST